ncbi:MAG: hypothetical protein ACRC6K_00090 [Fusobacteriaceae bacterium]
MTKVLKSEDNYIEFRTKLTKGEKIDYNKIIITKFEYRDGVLSPKLSRTLEEDGDTYLISRMLMKAFDSGKEIKFEDKTIISTCNFLRDNCFKTEKLIDEMLEIIKENNFPKEEVKTNTGK